MTVDLEAIARRGRCDVSSLRIALPLLEQGYSPPFLARYRRDELSGLNESNLWALDAAVRADNSIRTLKDELETQWQATPLKDPAIGHAIRKSNSQRVLDRLARRVKQESGESPDPASILAVRLMNPQKGDSNELRTLAESIDSIPDADAAISGLDESVARRLTGDPRVISAAVRWLAKHARIHISKISDPHTPAATDQKAAKKKSGKDNAGGKKNEPTAAAEATSDSSAAAQPDVAAQAPAEPVVETPSTAPAEAAAESTNVAVATGATQMTEQNDDAAADPAVTTSTSEAALTTEADSATDSTADTAPQAEVSAEAPAVATEKKQPENPKAKEEKAAAPKKAKKVSPRQRRRRWLVSVLKPLSGKRYVSDKLSSFQIVMLGRAMRSQVAQCSFEYDAAKLVEEIKRVSVGLNKSQAAKLSELVMVHEANIREAAEAAWWDELHERASVRLAGIAADHLRRQMNRGGVDAKIVMSIDAVGPRTAATAIVSADGQVLHCEDLPCQLSSGQRAAAVAKMGELIHKHHVDLIVISNGPSRRACMIALGELIKQSPEASLRWTLADRSGADTYAGSDVAGQEMRSTSRRFRAAAWLAFSVLQPAHAISKVDPQKLRLASFQRELSEEAMKESLDNVMTSGASRGGVDANGASVASLERLPGMTVAVAKAIDAQRRDSLIKSRDELLELDGWQTVAESRQALPFLRVFGSEEALDGTLIHPDDYPLAKKLAKALEIELPPATPPGYQLPEYLADVQATEGQPGLKESQMAPAPAIVEDLTQTGDAVDESFGEGATATDEVTSAGETASEESSADGDTEEPSAAEATVEAEAPNENASANESGGSDSPAASEPDGAQQDTSQEVSASADDEEAASSEEKSDADEPAADANAEKTSPQATELVKRPRPEKAKIDKCIKEWQVGPNRVNQLVSWLCDPFGDSDETGEAPAVMTTMPTQKKLKPGDQVIGVVVGVMPFGVFVELAPDCSGLVHVSKASDSYVEDLHEAIQVGDVITAWVTSIDEKKKRVALSAISPEREAQLRQEKQNRSSGGGRGQGGPRGGRGGSQSRSHGGGQRSGGQNSASQSSGGSGRGGQGGPSRGGPSRGGSSRGGQGGASRGKPSGRSGGRSGRSDSRGGRGGRRDRKPETYNVVGKKEKVELSDEMKKGEAPLRSFGDLMQFFDKDEAKPQEVKQVKQKPAAEPTEQPAETPTTKNEAVGEVVSTDAPTVDAPANETKTSDTPPASEQATTEPTETPDS